MDLLDNPLITNSLFYPRPAQAGTHTGAHVHDGTLPVADDIALGYRLYARQADAPLLVYFHGNGEIAPDHDGLADEYHRAGASLLVVDYRGYGWSNGRPKVSTLLSDAEAVLKHLPELTAQHGLSAPFQVVMGRSLGSAPAIHLAHAHPDAFRGLIIESGFAKVLHLLLRRGFPADVLNGLDPVGNARKIAELDLSLLVIHGEQDDIIPVEHGQTLYDHSPAADKHILRIAGAGHNDLLYRAMSRYFAAIQDFLTRVTP